MTAQLLFQFDQHLSGLLLLVGRYLVFQEPSHRIPVVNGRSFVDSPVFFLLHVVVPSEACRERWKVVFRLAT
jgi:hypothetical protein